MKKNLGLLFGISAYCLWGLFPLYWPLLKEAGAFEIVAHRAIWTMVFCTIVLIFRHETGLIISLLKNKRSVMLLGLATLLISINWLTYIWATNHQHVVESALGYYINPLVLISFGTLFLKEKLRKLQWVAVGLGLIGVTIMTIDLGHPPYIAITLALSWGSYGFVKKQLGLGSLESLAIETLIAFIPYFIYILVITKQGNGHFGHGFGITALLMGAGVITAVPLLLFNGAAVRLTMTMTGLLQFITPTLQFTIGVAVRHEVVSTGRWIGFITIWFALIALGSDLIQNSRANALK